MSIDFGNQVIRHTEAIVLAKGAQLRNPADRVRIAILNNELSSTQVGASYKLVRCEFERWLEVALQEDKRDTADYMDVQEARAKLADRKIPKPSDRLQIALNGDEIRGTFREGLRWFIPRAEFENWLECLAAEVVMADDGSISVTEAAALAACDGFPGARNYIMMACINHEMTGAYRDGQSWRIPYETFKGWMEGVMRIAEEMREEPEVEEPATRTQKSLGCACLLLIPVVIWLCGLLGR